jgi:RNA polymerase sigma-70 factor (ECF subfamily)
MDVARLYEEHHAALFRYLFRLTGDGDLAADAVQETFARMLARPPRNENPKAWLFAVATNQVRAWANRTKRRLALVDTDRAARQSADPPASPDAAAHAGEVRRTVREALDALSEKERTVLLMREEGFAHREIAAAIGTTTGSVGTMIARALDKLAERLSLDAEDLP